MFHSMISCPEVGCLFQFTPFFLTEMYSSCSSNNAVAPALFGSPGYPDLWSARRKYKITRTDKEYQVGDQTCLGRMPGMPETGNIVGKCGKIDIASAKRCRRSMFCLSVNRSDVADEDRDIKGYPTPITTDLLIRSRLEHHVSARHLMSSGSSTSLPQRQRRLRQRLVSFRLGCTLK